MKLKTVFFLSVLMVLGMPAYGHLGESLDSVKARLGNPTIPEGVPDEQIFAQRPHVLSQKYSFSPTGYTVDSFFINNICVVMAYLILDPKGWTDDRIQDLLLKNSEGKIWTETTPTATEAQKESDSFSHRYIRTWKRSDGATATRDGAGLIFTSPTYLQAIAAAKAQATMEIQKVPNL